MSVIFRKVTNGFRSVWGAQVYADICSVTATAKIHGINALDAIKICLAGNSVIPIPIKGRAITEEEGLQENARIVGEFCRNGLLDLASRHECIGDVRGYGLFFGAELVTDRETKAPATRYASRVANEMRQRGVLMNKLGIHYNTLKIRPPMPFSIENAEFMLETLDGVLCDLGMADE